MKKILDIVEKPPFTFLLYPAYRTSILSTREYTEPWFLSSFVLFSCNDKGMDFGVEFVGNPFLEEIDLKYRTKNIRRTICRIKRTIDKGIYVSLMWDESMVSCRPQYKKNHFKHMVLIYGYDLKEKIFNVLGFTHQNIYTKSTVTFEEFATAYKFFDKSNWKYFIWSNKRHIKFNFQHFNKTIEWYVDSKYPIISRLLRSRSFLKDKIFGLSVYNFLLSELNKQKIERKALFDVLEAFTAYCEHKTYMLNAFEYINNNIVMNLNLDCVIDEFKYLVRHFKTLKCMQIKYTLTLSPELVDKMIEEVKLLSVKEEKVLKKYIEMCKNNKVF